MYIEKLKAMFDEMVVKKNLSVLSFYYHQDFLLYTNGIEMNYAAFLESHRKIYEEPITYQIEFEEETFLEQEDKVAGRIWITTSLPNEKPNKIEVVLIAQFKDRQIYRIWELTYPDWSQLPAFKEIDFVK